MANPNPGKTTRAAVVAGKTMGRSGRKHRRGRRR